MFVTAEDLYNIYTFAQWKLQFIQFHICLVQESERADIKLYLSKAQLLIRGGRYTGIWWYRGIELIPFRYLYVCHTGNRIPIIP